MSAHVLNAPRKETPRASRALHGAAIGCFFVSGFAGLVCEVCWIRKASLVFGAATYAISTVLAVFFAGLALGSYVFGKYSQRSAHPLRTYAFLELGVGLAALLSPAAFRLADVLYGRFYGSLVGSFALLTLARFILISIVILPPTILMGGSLPLFCRHFVRSRSRIATSVGLLYGLNTLGAAVGCAICGFWLMPAIGANGAIYVAGTLSVLVAALILLMYKSGPANDGRAQRTAEPGADMDKPDGRLAPSTFSPAPTILDLPSASRHAAVYGLFFLAGAVALGSEVLWTRYLSLLIHNTVHTYTLILTVVLIGIVLGSVLTCRIFDKIKRRALAFGLLQVLSGLIVLTLLALPAPWWKSLLADDGLSTRLWALFLILTPPAVLSGAAFPLAVRMVVEHPATAGVGVGTMTAVNTLGGIAGSLLAGFLLLPVAGLQATLLALTGAALVIGFAAWFGLDRATGTLVKVVSAAAAAALWFSIPWATGTHLPQDFLASRGELVDFREGLGSHLAIVSHDGARRLEIDRLWQGEDRKTHQIMAAHVPMILHPHPKEVLLVGVGTGQTPSRFLMYDIDRLECVEIESTLLGLIRKHYDCAWMDDPRVRFITEDGRNYLTHIDRTYDVISIEVGQTFRPGVAAFYTVDFYRRARRRLNADGFLCQFAPIGFFAPGELRDVVATFVEIFPRSVLWYNTAELLLIGTTGDRVSLRGDRLHRLESIAAVQDDLRYAYWGGPEQWLNRPEAFISGFLCGPKGLAALSAGAGVYRDDPPRLEYTASAYRPSQELANLEAIRRILDTPSTALDYAMDVETLAAAESLRGRNLDDIAAVSVARGVDDLKAQGRYGEIVTLLEKALRWNPENAKYNRLMGDALKLSGQWQTALAYCQEAVRINPQDPRAQHGLAHTLHTMGRPEEAKVHYAEAIRLDDTEPEVLHNFAVLLFQSGDLAAADAHLQRALSIRPDYPEALNLRAVVLTRLPGEDRSAEALACYEKALSLRPDYADAHNNLGVLLNQLHRPAEAMQHFEAALRYNPNDLSARVNWADGLSAAGRWQEAVAGYQQILQAAPNSAKVHHHLASALAKLGRADDAIVHYQTALRLRPDNAEAQKEFDALLGQRAPPAGAAP